MLVKGVALGREVAEMLKITDFADARNVDRNAVTQYIRRHDDLFKGHTKVKANCMFVDDEAVILLEKKYPLPRPIEVVEDIETIKELSETRKELAKAEKRIEEIQKQLLEASKQIAQAEATQMLLEDKEAQLEREYERSAKAEERATTAEARIASAEGQMESLRTEIEKLQEELERERAKTWVQKLFGKG